MEFANGPFNLDLLTTVDHGDMLLDLHSGLTSITRLTSATNLTEKSKEDNSPSLGGREVASDRGNYFDPYDAPRSPQQSARPGWEYSNQPLIYTGGYGSTIFYGPYYGGYIPPFGGYGSTRGDPCNDPCNGGTGRSGGLGSSGGGYIPSGYEPSVGGYGLGPSSASYGYGGVDAKSQSQRPRRIKVPRADRAPRNCPCR